MDNSKWNKYEEKKRELKKQYKSKYVIIWLIWLAVVTVGIISIVLLREKIRIEIMVLLIVIFIGFSLFFALNKTGEYIRSQKQQEKLLEQDEPFGKFKT